MANLLPFATRASSTSPGAAASLIPAPTTFFSMAGASGASEVDNVTGLSLTQVGGVTSAAGKIGNCRSFASGSSQYFTVPDSPLLRGNAAMTIAGWYNLTDKTAYHYILHKGVTNANVDREYIFLFNQGSGNMQCQISNGSGVAGAITVQLNPSVATWYAFCLKWDGTNLYVASNGGAFSSIAYSLPQGTAGDLRVGASVSPLQSMNGMIDALAFWRGTLLSDVQWQSYYNAGTGREWNGSVWA